MLGFALHPGGETIIKSFVLNVTKNRHHCASQSFQHLPVFRVRLSQTLRNSLSWMRLLILEYNFHYASSTGLIREAGVQNYKTLLERPTKCWVFTVKQLLPTCFWRLLWACWFETGFCLIYVCPPSSSHISVRHYVPLAMIREKHDSNSLDLGKWGMQLSLI